MPYIVHEPLTPYHEDELTKIQASDHTWNESDDVEFKKLMIRRIIRNNPGGFEGSNWWVLAVVYDEMLVWYLKNQEHNPDGIHDQWLSEQYDALAELWSSIEILRRR